MAVFDVRQITERHEGHRVQRVSDPAQPATLSVGAQAHRIDGRRPNCIAQGLSEAIRPLDLLADFLVGHFGSGRHDPSGSPRYAPS